MFEQWNSFTEETHSGEKHEAEAFPVVQFLQ